jgi:hypothetical protein
VLTDPVSKLGFIELAGCEGQDKRHDSFLGGFDAETVKPEEEIHGLESHAFVPVNERMVVGEPKAISRSERSEVWVRTVVELILGTLQCRFEEPPIPKAGRAAVCLDLIRVNGENMYESKPTRFNHLASSRMALR